MDYKPRRSAATSAAAAAAKASWHAVDASDRLRDADVISGHGSSPIFKPRRAVGRRSAAMGKPIAATHTGHDDPNPQEHLPNRKSSRGPPSLVNRPRSSTGFENYFDETDASSKLRSLKMKASLQDLKRLTLWQQNPLSSPRERKCVSAMEKRDFDSKYGVASSETSVEKKTRSDSKNSGKLSNRHQDNEGKPPIGPTVDDELDTSGKLKAFRALVGPGPKSRRAEPSLRDISNEELKRARSLSSGIEEIGGYVKFSSQSWDKLGVRASTPLHLGDEKDSTLDYNMDRIAGTAVSVRSGRSSGENIKRENHPAQTVLERDQRSDLPLSYKGGNLKGFEYFEKGRETGSENKESVRPNENSRFSEPCVSEGSVDRSSLYYQRRDPRRIIKRSPDRAKESSHETRNRSEKENDEKSQKSSSNFSTESASLPGQYGDIHSVRRDGDIHRFASHEDELRSGRNSLSRWKHDGAQRASTEADESHSRHFSRFNEARPASSLELLSRLNHDDNHHARTRPSSSIGLPSHNAHHHQSLQQQSYSKDTPPYTPLSSNKSTSHSPGIIESSFGASNQSHGRRLSHDDDEGDTHRGSRHVEVVPGREASLKTHLNFLGASLSSLSSRLNSGSESDLRSHTGGSDDAVPRVRRSPAPSLSDACRSGAGGAAEYLSRDSTAALTRRQSGGGSSPFDLVGVKVSLREDGHNLQTWASSSSLFSGSGSGKDAAKADDGVKHRHRPASVAGLHDHSLLSETSVCEIGSPHGGRQTNVRMALRDGEQNGSLSHRSSSSSALSCSSPDHRNSPRSAGIVNHEAEDNESSTSKKRLTKDTLRKLAQQITTSRKDVMGSKTGTPENSPNMIHSKNTSNRLSSRQSYAESESSENSFDSTLVSDGTTDEKKDVKHKDGKSRNQNMTSTENTPNKNIGKGTSPKIISRKVPIKAVHPGSPDAEGRKNMTHSRKETTSPSNKRQISPDENSKNKERHILVRRPPEKQVVEGSQRQDKTFRDKGATASKSDTKSGALRNLVTARSKSSLGIFSSTNSSLLESPLPSKTNIKHVNEKIRPQTALAIPTSATSKLRQQRHSKSHASSNGMSEDYATSKGALLKQKVQKLHEDIDKRLQSKANASHSLSISYDKHDKDEDFDASHLSEASTILREDTPDDRAQSQSPRTSKHCGGAGYYSASSSPLSSPKPGFTTSTPVKNGVAGQNPPPNSQTKRQRLLRRLAREFSNENTDVEERDDNIITDIKGRFTPELMSHLRSNSKRKTSRLIKGSTENTDDSEGDERDAKESLQTGLRRSESVGSLQRLEVSRKEDYLGRILDKISAGSSDRPSLNHVTGADLVSKWQAGSGGRADVGFGIPSGRSSPADMLLGHLDNPQMVKLLQRLYKADPDTRKVIMVKFQYFKAWQFYATDSRDKRLRKEALANKSEAHLRHRLLCLHFIVWWHRASHCTKVRQADALWRRHTLVKGLRALRWSLSQSRHLEARIQTSVRTAALGGAFAKWKVRTVKHRHERKEKALARWKQFVTETKKVRHMRELMDFNIQLEVMRCWQKRYRKRIKLNMAFHFFRRTLWRKTLNVWRFYVSQCKLAQEKLTSAVTQHQNSLLQSAFYTMLITFKKVKKAKGHFRAYKLSETLWAWREASQVCRAERLRDMALSTDHWRATRLKQGFSHWHERLLVRRVIRVSHGNLCRSAFSVWFSAWQRNIEQREAIEETLARNKLRGTLLTWRQNVVQLRRRQKRAVALIEHCHLKQTFRFWRLYTAGKGILRKKVLIRRIERSRETLALSFSVWKEAFRSRQEEVEKKQLWSNHCARKLAAQWRLMCHKRKLSRLYTQVLLPMKEERLIRAMFVHWTKSLACRHRETQCAEKMSERLQRSRLRACFRLWQGELMRARIVKPILQNREHHRLAECVSAWRSYVVQKSMCRSSLELFKKKDLKTSFSMWKRHYHVCQVAKQAQTRTLQGLLLCTLDAWKFLIDRKRKSRDFQRSRLTWRMFILWRGRASFEMDRRARMEVEQANNRTMMEQCFQTWRENARAQVVGTEQRLEGFVRSQSEAGLTRAFLSWRRHMHSTLIARAYQKSQQDRLVATLFNEWRLVSSHMLRDAVHAFSERIGLLDHVTEVNGAESGIGATEDDLDYEEELNKSSAGSYSSTFSVGSSARRLFGETMSSFDTDTDRMVLLSGGLQAAVDNHQLRCQRLKETAVLAIRRLTNWPVCLAFAQWREFTATERQLKEVAQLLRGRCSSLEQAQMFRIWRDSYSAARRAKEHRNRHLTVISLESLRLYKNYRKYVDSLTQRARQQCILVAGRKFFYPWLKKAQEQRKQREIMHLWTSRTEQEMQLLPLESQLINQISRRSLLVCFSVWLVRYRAVTNLRTVYRQSLLSWVFTAWQNWAELRHQLAWNSRQFCEQRRTKMAFHQWQERLRQSREAKRKYHLAWKSYLLLIVQQWRVWATASKRLALMSQAVYAGVCRRQLAASFSRWRSMAVKVKAMKSNQAQRMTYRVFVAWRQESVRRRVEKSRVLQCQVRSYTLLVARLFHAWSAAYRLRLQQRQERQLLAEQTARTWGRVWRQRTQTSRGQRFKGELDRRKMSKVIDHWTTRLERVHELTSLLEAWQRKRGSNLLASSLQTWRLQLASARAVRLHQGRLLVTVLGEWRVFTKDSKDRRIRGLALKQALQERSLHVYFRYWVAMTTMSQSVQQSAEKRLQLRVFRAWRHQARSESRLRALGSHFQKHVETRILRNAFQNLRWRADYCAGLQDTMASVLRDKERATLKAVLTVWRDRMDDILVGRCRTHFLMVRVVRQWQRFLAKRNQQRQTDAENMAKAVKKCNITLCRKVFSSLKREVDVSKLAQKRRLRLCYKYARIWKTKVDYTVTAVTMERELVTRRVWVRWRVEYSRRFSAHKVKMEEERYLVTMVFKAWRRACLKMPLMPVSLASPRQAYLKPVTFSSLPVPSSPSSLASSSPSSSSTASLLPVPVSQQRAKSSSPLSPSSSPSSSLSASERSFGYRGTRPK